jgi:hypothetical protein
MKTKFKEASILFIIQVILYTLLCINYRSVALVNYHEAAITDFLIASMNFFVIRKISTGTESLHQWVGYVIGSVVGSYLGIYLSTILN